MPASIDATTPPSAIRMCLNAIRPIVQHTERVERLKPATLDDDPPHKVQASMLLRGRAAEVQRQAVAVRAHLTRALADCQRRW